MRSNNDHDDAENKINNYSEYFYKMNGSSNKIASIASINNKNYR